MFNLPLACMSKEMGIRIKSTVGKVEEVDVDEEGVGKGGVSKSADSAGFVKTNI
jgi:hypothetical protein